MGSHPKCAGLQSLPLPTAVEGWYRASRKEYVKFLYIARGSNAELNYLAEVAHRQGYLTQDQKELLINGCEEIGKLLTALTRSLKNNK